MRKILRTTGAGTLGPVSVEALLGREKGPVVVLLHGVHGTANLAEENKYGKLARMLGPDTDVVIVETSRLCRDPQAFGDDRGGWAKAAFGGKSYAMELCDVLTGLAAAADFGLKGHPLWLWGFSLGGLHAVMIAGGEAKRLLARESLGSAFELPGPLDGLALSGSGLEGREELEGSGFFSLPILDSLPSTETLGRAARSARVRRALSFYGSRDGTFSEGACRDLLGFIEATEKGFHVLEGVDHAFRTLYGESSDEPLRTMTGLLLPL